MREAKIVCKSPVHEFNSLDELIDSNDFVGIMIGADKYLMCQDRVLGVSAYASIDMSEYELSELSENFRFFIFDSANELYRWMIEGE